MKDSSGSVRDTSTSCKRPGCGGTARVPSGHYTVVGDEVSVLASDPPSAQRLDQIITVIEGLRDRGAQADEVVKEIEETAPEIAGFLSLLGSPQGIGVMTLLALLLSVLAFVHTLVDANQAVSREDVARITAEALKRAGLVSASPVPGPPRPSPSPHQHQRNAHHGARDERAGEKRRADERKRKARQARQARKRNRRSR